MDIISRVSLDLLCSRFWVWNTDNPQESIGICTSMKLENPVLAFERASVNKALTSLSLFQRQGMEEDAHFVYMILFSAVD